MKIGKFLKFVIKTLTAAIAIGSIAYIIKDIMDNKNSYNFDDTWDDDLYEDFDDMFDDVDSEDVTSTREYVKMDPSKMSAESCEE